MHLNTPFLFLKFKNFLRRGHTPSCTHPLGASTFAPLALTHAPPTRKLATSLYLSYNKQHKIQNKFKINNEIGTDVICKDSLRRHSAVTEHARNIAGMATRNLTHKWHQYSTYLDISSNWSKSTPRYVYFLKVRFFFFSNASCISAASVSA